MLFFLIFFFIIFFTLCLPNVPLSTRRTLGEHSGTWTLEEHSGSPAYRRLRYLGTSGTQVLGCSVTWALRVLEHSDTWVLKALRHSTTYDTQALVHLRHLSIQGSWAIGYSKYSCTRVLYALYLADSNINLLHFEPYKKFQSFINLMFQFGLIPTKMN